MIHSKATAVLMRLKEMDRKYKIKHKKDKRTYSPVSTESSLENTSKSGNNKVVGTFLGTNKANEIASEVSPEPKMKLQIPSPRVNNGKSSEDEDIRSKKSSRISPRRKTKVSVEIEENKKRENLRRENFLGSVLNLESASRSDFKGNSLIKDDVSEDFQRHSEESSVVTIFSKRSTAPETVSEVIKSKNASPSRRNEGKLNVMTENSISETTIDEVIKISDEMSEIISELFDTMDKDDRKDEDPSNASSIEEQKLQYENDTFEEASNSSSSSSSTEMHAEKSSEELAQGTVISGVKKIKITSHKEAESTQEKVIIDEKDKEIIELIAPKIIKSNSECDVGLDEELSNYVKTTENVDEVLPINLLKLSKQTTPAKKHVRRSRKQRKSSNENTEDSSVVSDDHQRLTKANKTEDVASKEATGPSATIKSGSSEEEPPKETLIAKEASLSKEEARVEIEKEVAKDEKEPQPISNEKILTEIPKKSDVTSTLRELNKDAINAIVRRRRIQTIGKISSDKPRCCRNCKAIAKLPSSESEAPENVQNNESKSASSEDIRKDSSHKEKARGRRTKVKRVSKASKARKTSHQGTVEEKHSRFECIQTRHLRKQAAVLRIQQEREDIRNYLLELERTRLEYGPGETMASSKFTAFKPLEFPQILAFKKPDLEDSNLSRDAFVALQEKILTIKQWLKDQYLLYRDYSNLAQTVNAKYIPASLEDAKKTIHQLQRTIIESK